MIHFRCRRCNRHLATPDHNRGRVCHCPHCGGLDAVPDFRNLEATLDYPQQVPSGWPALLASLLVASLLLLVCYFILGS